MRKTLIFSEWFDFETVRHNLMTFSSKFNVAYIYFNQKIQPIRRLITRSQLY